MKQDRFRVRPQVPAGARFIGSVFGLVFFGIGLTVIIFLWSQPFGQFGSPPLIFRIFGSFIATAFVAMGGTVAYSAMFGALPETNVESQIQPPESDRTAANPDVGYGCPKCGAPLQDDADVSPHGDVRCGFCECWFNIHGK